MGLIHSRAAKKRAKIETKMLTAQYREMQREAAGDSLLRQPTLGALLSKLAERREPREP